MIQLHAQSEIFDSIRPVLILRELMRTVPVSLGSRSYPILVGNQLLSRLGSECKKLGLGAKCVVITDANVGSLYSKSAIEHLQNAGFDPHEIQIPTGETAKSLKVVEECYNNLAAQRIERKSFVVALGGGVVGDLAGFVAASYLRGLAFVQVPTTLLAQVDSSVGGKVGVNLKAGKNLVGAFYQPRLVICDLDSLKTLPEREFRAGLAEVIKYGIIHDEALFRRLEREMKAILNRDPKILAPIIARCCEIKADVVGKDETESGLRAILNFGHTVGHGLEAISGYGKYLHGEAISIGQIVAARISQKSLTLKQVECDRIRNLFAAAGLPVSIKLTEVQKKRLFSAMTLDKKVSDGEVKFVLARRIGRVEFGHKVSRSVIDEALKETSQ
jgi:3-dehydroquinate synthase